MCAGVCICLYTDGSSVSVCACVPTSMVACLCVCVFINACVCVCCTRHFFFYLVMVRRVSINAFVFTLNFFFPFSLIIAHN